MQTTRFLALSLLVAFPACHLSPSDEAGARLYAGFGHHHRAVSTQSPEAQRWFDQGLELLFGFNHDEAIRSFERAAELDPECTMAHWGIAYANGFHINKTDMSADASRRAFLAAERALSCRAGATAVERGLVEAVATRYAWPVPDDRKPQDLAYAAAMGELWKAFPGDSDVGALYAESLMDLQPWDLWTKDGEPKGRTAEIVAVLEAVLERAPLHPGANHFYIHAVEASPDPARAVAAADRLADLVPGAGHLVHMPSHIYTRVGRYADASDVNERAIAVDRAYFALAPEPDFYSLYFVHNIHFLAYAAMMEGRSQTSLATARRLATDVPREFLVNYTSFADGLMATPLHVMIRFGMWDAILAEPEPEDFRLLSRALHSYARGVALSALERTSEARAELARFDERAARVPEDWVVGNNKSKEVLALSRSMLLGELRFREGAVDEAFDSFRAGVRMEDELVYDEPPGWMQPVRHAFGALLLSAGRHTEAEEVYRADLEHNPENGWSLLGLEQALVAQDENADVRELRARRSAAWRRADVQPSSSCFCEPRAIAASSDQVSGSGR